MVVTWGAVVALVGGVVIGTLWPFTAKGREDSDNRLQDPALRRWSRKAEATAGVVALILGTVLAAAGGSYFGRPFDFYPEPGTMPDLHDPLDAAAAIAGVGLLGVSGFMLSRLVVDTYLGRERNKKSTRTEI